MQVWWSEQPTGVSAALEAAGGPSDGAWSWAGVKGTYDVGKPMGDFPLPQFPHCIAGWYLLRVPPPPPSPGPEQPSGHFHFLPASQGPGQGREELHEAQVKQKRHMGCRGAHLGSEVMGL